MTKNAAREQKLEKERQSQIVLFFRSKAGKTWMAPDLATFARTRFDFSGVSDAEVVQYLVQIRAVQERRDFSTKTVEYTVRAPDHADGQARARRATQDYNKSCHARSWTCPRCGGGSAVRGRHARTTRGHSMEECNAQMADGVLKS